MGIPSALIDWRTRRSRIVAYAKANDTQENKFWKKYCVCRDREKFRLLDAGWGFAQASRRGVRTAVAELFPPNWCDGMDLPPDTIDDGYIPPEHGGKRPVFTDTRPEESMRALLEGASDSSDRGLTRSELSWVYNNIDVSWGEIPPGSAPSKGAVAYLRWAKEEGRNEFFRSVPAKMLKDSDSDTGDGASEDELQGILDNFQSYLDGCSVRASEATFNDAGELK